MISKFDGFSQSEEGQTKKDCTSIYTYRNYGINISFKGWIEIIKNDYEEDGDYFYKSIEIIRFNENNKKLEANSQHLLSEETLPILDLSILSDTNQINDSLYPGKNYIPPSIDNDISKKENYSSLSNSFSYYSHLSSLYILPKMSRRKLKVEIESYVKKHPPFHISEKLKLGNKKVYKWRIQSGKTRLDHYVFFGNEYNYLFVSSPYGSNGVIENVILEMELVKKKHNNK
jgi:hypothetical protein